MKRNAAAWLLVTLLGIAVAGCGGKPADKPQDKKPSAAGAAYRLSAEPAGATGIKQARQSVADGAEVAIVGRIGGAVDPWVKGMAAFNVVDLSLKPCNETPGDNCETPWDYCCDTDVLPKVKALVKIVDAQGKTLQQDARELLGLKELETVVVRGKAQVGEDGALVILADGVFVRKS